MNNTVTFVVRGGSDVASLLDELAALYLEVYAEPPYGEGLDDLPGFLDALRRQSTFRGFRIVTAHDNAKLVGFTFGHSLGATTHWWDDAVAPLPDELTTETGDRTFAVIELLVKATHRRRGIARRLHDLLTAGLRTERITLLVRHEAEPARRAYAAWGYHQVGQIRPAHGPIGSADAPPTYWALVRAIDSATDNTAP